MKIKKEILKDIKAYMYKDKSIPEGWIYLGDEHERYVLGQPGTCNLLVFGVNPSTAVAGNDDPTIRKVRSIAEHDGFDGWIMVNLYPQIATDPEKLHVKADKDIIEINIAVLEAVANSYYINKIWAAWGDLIDKRYYLGQGLNKIIEVMNGADAEWYYRGTLTKKRNPRHPLYMKLEETMNWFAVADYATHWMWKE